MRRLVTLLAALLGACGPQPQPPVSVMALALNKDGVYRSREVKLRTVADVVALRGSVATLWGGARIVVDPQDPLLQLNGGNLTDAQLAEVFLKGKGMEPRASYVEKEGTLWPADFHTWNMVTTYYNFERSFDYFQAIYDGRPSEELLGTRVYYFPSFTTAASPQPLTDQALFFSPIQAIAVLPFERLQQVPFSINLGVIAHEFAHRVFNRKVYGGASVPAPLIQWVGVGSSTPAINLLKSMDEGLADFHAYGVTCLSDGCDPRFLIHSVDKPTADERDLSLPDKCMNPGLRNALDTLPVEDFVRAGYEYQVGTVLAAALYRAGSKAGKLEVLQKALLRAYHDTNPRTPGFFQLISSNLQTPQNFTVSAVANTILQHISDPELKKYTCNELWDRLQIRCLAMPCEELPDCPAESSRGNPPACPNP